MEIIEHLNDIHFYDFPASLIKLYRNAIRANSLVVFHLKQGCFDFHFSEWSAQNFIFSIGKLKFSPMVGRYSEILPNRVQILVLAPFLESFAELPALCVKWLAVFSSITRHTNDHFGNLQIYRVVSLI
jgi:hypothetical protein